MRPSGFSLLLGAFLASGALASLEAQLPTDPGTRGAVVALPNNEVVGLGTPNRSFREMIFHCGGDNPSSDLLAACQEGALAAVAGRGVLGLVASLGTNTPGSASTLGRGLAKTPRLAFGVRVGTVRSSIPRVTSDTNGPGRKRTVSVPALHVTATAGIFDGFSLTPNAGGLLSLDLMVSGQMVAAPSEKGFSDGITGWAVGGRVGLLRESFTLPGVSLSLTHGSLGKSGLGSFLDGDRVAAEFDATVRSFRGVVGKDLLGMGFLAGFGEDRYSGGISFSLADPPPGQLLWSMSKDLVTRRRLYFMGVSRTYLILQFSAEAGWAAGYDLELVEGAGTNYDPAGRSYFGSLACRLTF